AKVISHIGNVATVLSELAEKLEPGTVMETAHKLGDFPTTQRLGYLLEHVGANAAASSLATLVHDDRPRAVPLRSDRPSNRSRRNSRWNLLINEAVEAEA